MALVEVSHLVKHFVPSASLLRRGTVIRAVDDVELRSGPRRDVRPRRRIGKWEDNDRAVRPAAD